MFRLDDQTALNTLKTNIADCDAVICLVGDAYGGELRNRSPDQPRRSFTQWEYFFAQEFNKPIFRLATTKETPTDDQTAQPRLDPEPQELLDLQAQFRRLVLDDLNLRSFANVDQLRADLALLRFPWQRDTPTHKPFELPFGSIDSLFKGREDVLTELHHRLQSTASRTVAVTQVLHGLGGVGKTRLAIEYAHRYANDYCAVLFASADTPTNLESNLARLVAADALDLKEQAEKTKPAEQAAAVRRWLKENSGWLLILDNVDTDEARKEIQTLLKPGLGAGAVLVTGRNAHYANHISVLPLGVLDTPAATEYLLHATEGERQISPTDPADAEALAVAMGGLSLALEQAAAFISTKSIGFAEYLARWREGEDKVRAYYDPDKMQYARHLLFTWDTTFAQLDPAARRLLGILAWFAPEPIPRGVLQTKTAHEVFVALLAGQTDPGTEPTPTSAAPPLVDLEDALATLKKYALIRWDDTRTQFTIHRLVQEVTRERQSAEEQRSMVLSVCQMLNAFLPDEPPPNDVRAWTRWKPAAPHVDAVVSAADQRAILQPTARLMNELGLFEMALSRFANPERLFRTAQAIDEQSFGPDHPTVARDLNNLAQLLKATNRLADAEPLMRQALAIDEKCFGLDHPTVAINLNNLAGLLQASNRLAEAEPLMRRALAIDEQSFGPDHPTVARDLNNLAQLLQVTKRLAEAEPLMRRALAIDEQSLGPDHPDVATDLNNLAGLLQATNRLAEAEPLLRRALAIDEQSFGPDHPDVAINLNNLAGLLQATNRLADAEPLIRRVVLIFLRFRAVNGHVHPNLGISLRNLRKLAKKMGRTEEQFQSDLVTMARETQFPLEILQQLVSEIS
jgi:tetratricopeptide (TPR) repeat protein